MGDVIDGTAVPLHHVAAAGLTVGMPAGLTAGITAGANTVRKLAVIHITPCGEGGTIVAHVALENA